MFDAILFDLDGTLLGLDNDGFVKVYFQALAPKLAPVFGDADFTQPIIFATDAMYRADGSMNSLREVFIQAFNRNSPVAFERVEPIFIDFYQNEFEQVRAISRPL
ncbi:HAD family hydrolase, partial [candidate division KSB1 bacterium]|nr:HAD family hydrolase [candidate division KSB1 bacterium]